MLFTVQPSHPHSQLTTGLISETGRYEETLHQQRFEETGACIAIYRKTSFCATVSVDNLFFLSEPVFTGT